MLTQSLYGEVILTDLSQGGRRQVPFGRNIVYTALYSQKGTGLATATMAQDDLAARQPSGHMCSPGATEPDTKSREVCATRYGRYYSGYKRFHIARVAEHPQTRARAAPTLSPWHQCHMHARRGQLCVWGERHPLLCVAASTVRPPCLSMARRLQSVRLCEASVY
jgi:hypothetical protein